MSSRTEFSENEMQIIRLAQDGLSPIEIKEVIKRSTPRAISVVLCRARKAGILEIKTQAGVGVQISARVHEQFEMEAAERKMRTHDLIRLILKNVIEDDLFDAVLQK